jgi:CMP-N-acetylneuraminic acid synthetase
VRLVALGLVIARGGSKGLPRKNVLPLKGRPVIAHTIEAALGCRALTRTILSSEDAEILEVGRRAGCPAPFVRPAELADDHSSTVAVALHALDWLASHEGFTPDVVVLLPATAPLRRTEHIEGALDALCGDGAAEAVVAVTEPDYSPYWMLTLSGGRLSWLFPEHRTVSRRQDLPAAYRPNGSIYAVRVSALREQRTFYPRATGAYVMPRDSSVNIDSEMELRLAEVLLARRSA